MEVSEIVTIKERVEAELLDRPGVTGVDVGYKYVDGQRTNEVAIRVLVEEKKARVPAGQKVPGEIEGVQTDVIERRFELHQIDNRMRVDDLEIMADTTTYDPLKGGISIGPCRSIGGYVYTGTAGAIVKDNVTGDPMFLSNFHVMCVDNGWNVGDTMTQPSRVDTGACPGGVIGSLVRATLSASVDGAVCSLTSSRSHQCEIVDIGKVAGTKTAALNMAVRKRGRTTGLTHGKVDSISLTVNVNFGDGIGVKTLTNQIGIAPDTAQNASFGNKGDSGSVVVDEGRNVVGLYFAGSSDGTGVANQIASVLSELNVSMCTSSPKALIKDLKDGKVEIKEGKREKIEIKEGKREKIEIKEQKIEIKEGKREKIEIKEQKIEKVERPEWEKPPASEWDPKGIVENPIDLPGGGLRPPFGGLEERLAALEAAVGQMATFITGAQRPDLSAGALVNEEDLDPEALQELRQQLAQQAAQAAAAKAAFDTDQR
jgi:hypothetical protein